MLYITYVYRTNRKANKMYFKNAELNNIEELRMNYNFGRDNATPK